MAQRKVKRNPILTFQVQHNTDQRGPQARVQRKRRVDPREYMNLTRPTRARLQRVIETAKESDREIACLLFADELWVSVVL